MIFFKNFYKKIDLWRRDVVSCTTEKTIPINWARILTFVFFWTYGIYGFFSIPSLGVAGNIVVSLLMTGVLVYVFSLKNSIYFTDRLRVTKRDIVIFGSYFVGMFIFSYGDLFLSIDQDQLYHSQQAVLPSLLIVRFLQSHVSAISGFSFVQFLWVSNIFIVAGVVALYFVIRKFGERYQVALLAGSFIVVRCATFLFGGNTSSFPTFRLFPIWLSGTFLSPGDFGFRMATFVGLIVLMWATQRIMSKKVPLVYSYFFGLFVGTIPVLWHVGTIVEASLWASFCWILVLLWVNEWTEGVTLNYVRTMAVVAIFTTMRVSSFVVLVPLGFIMAVDLFKRKIHMVSFARALSLSLVFIPTIIMSIVVGSPATYTGAVSLMPPIHAHAGIIERITAALQSGAFTTYVYNSIRFPLVLLLCILPLLLVENYRKFFPTLVLFVSGFVIFYSIEPGLWGNGRYQAEYIAPFIVLSAYLGLVFLYKKKLYPLFIVVLLVMINISLYAAIPNMNKASRGYDNYFQAMKMRSDYFVLSDFPYEYKDALKTAKQDGYAGSVYYANGYGYFAEVLSGYSLGEMKQEKDIIDRIGVVLNDETAGKIDASQEINIVIFNGSEKNTLTSSEKLASSLRNRGWVTWKNFTNAEYGNTLYGLQRGYDMKTP